MWFQTGQWLVFGADVTAPGAAVTDQSDGWTGLAITGELTCDVMDRLAAIDVRTLRPGQVARTELSELIASVHDTLAGLAGGGTPAKSESQTTEASLAPAVPIDASVGRDEITCLECGKGFKTLKRHLSAEHDLSPGDYRARWQLSKDYPLVAPSYSERRADTAKKIGLGRKPKAGRRKKK